MKQCNSYIKDITGNSYLYKNSQAVKKSVRPQDARIKKDVKSNLAAKKWLW